MAHSSTAVCATPWRSNRKCALQSRSDGLCEFAAISPVLLLIIAAESQNGSDHETNKVQVAGFGLPQAYAVRSISAAVAPEQPCQHPLVFLNPNAAQVLAVQLDHVKGAQFGARMVPMMAKQVEHRQALVVSDVRRRSCMNALAETALPRRFAGSGRQGHGRCDSSSGPRALDGGPVCGSRRA
jgi:hypothetical protein